MSVELLLASKSQCGVDAPAKQLELFQFRRVQEFVKTPEQQAVGDRVLQEAIWERLQAEKIARELFPDRAFKKLYEFRGEEWALIWKTFYDRFPPGLQPKYVAPEIKRWMKLGATQEEFHDLHLGVLDSPEVYGGIKSWKPLFAAWKEAGLEGVRNYWAKIRNRSRKPSKPKTFKPWSRERKLQNRLRKLDLRARKLYTLLPDEYIEYIQTELLQNPEYYGICPLLGSVESCKLNYQDYVLDFQQARLLEAQLREQESGLVQPLNLPLVLKVPEKELVQVGAQLNFSSTVTQ